MNDLKPVYKTSNGNIAMQELANLKNKWDDIYPIVIKSWYNDWENLSTYFKYPPKRRNFKIRELQDRLIRNPAIFLHVIFQPSNT